MVNPTHASGLCSTCIHKREIRSDRGSVFTQCARSFTDPRYDKYPRLPVLRCPGYESRPPSAIPLVSCLLFVFLFLFQTGCNRSVNQGPHPFFQLALRTFGYHLPGSKSVRVDYTDLAFLSEDLLLVCINQTSKFGVANPDDDIPDSRLILIDLRSARVIASTITAVEKMAGSVKALANGRFAVLNQAGLRLCDADLTCGPPLATRGGLVVSPLGKTMAVGGFGRSPIRIIDSATGKQTAIFPYVKDSPRSIGPGDDAIAVSPHKRFVLPSPGKAATTIPGGSLTLQRPDGTSTPTAINEERGSAVLFLNERYLAFFRSNKLIVVAPDGTGRHEYPAAQAWKTTLISCLSGARFAIYEHGYTSLNALLHLTDMKNVRTENYERVRVIDLPSGAERTTLEWDPRTRASAPALSPAGQRIARLRDGFVEVLQLDR